MKKNYYNQKNQNFTSGSDSRPVSETEAGKLWAKGEPITHKSICTIDSELQSNS